jgi:predicted metal-dependent peptidase
MDLKTKLVAARANMFIDHPWFGSLAMRLELVEATPEQEREIWGARGIPPTMATDGHRLIFARSFVEELSMEHLKGVIAHEVLHCALLHPYRRGQRDVIRWNIACDYAINLLIKDSALKLPDGCLMEEKYRGLSADVIYGMLPQAPTSKQAKAAGMGGVLDSKSQTRGKGEEGGEGEDEEGEGQGQGDANEMTETDWAIAAQQAEAAARVAGKMPAHVARAIDQAKESREDWRGLLKRFIVSTVAVDYSWARPNRRFLASGLILPGLFKENAGVIGVAIDTSGSVTPDMLAQFAGEIQAIASEVRPEKTHVVYCDSDINGEDTFTPDQTVELKMVGGGGTAFGPVFKWVEEKQEAGEINDLKALIYLTDLESYDRPVEPDYPVLWVTPNWVSKVAPWGETIRLSGGEV